MKMFKKITSAALAVAMMLTSGAAFAAFEDVDIENTDRESVAINVVTGNANFASQRSFYTNGSEGQKLSVKFENVALRDMWKLYWGLDNLTNSWPDARRGEKAFATIDVNEYATDWSISLPFVPGNRVSIMWGYDVPDQAGQNFAPDAYLDQQQEFLVNGHITHAEAAQFVLNMITADYGYDALATAVERGIVDNSFAAVPSALLTNDEAIEMVVNALGYKGTPAGDDGLGILDGVVTGSEPTTRSNLAVIIYNSLFVGLGPNFADSSTHVAVANLLCTLFQDYYSIDTNNDGDVNDLDVLPLNVVLLHTSKDLVKLIRNEDVTRAQLTEMLKNFGLKDTDADLIIDLIRG